MAETIITNCTARLNEMLSQELDPLRGAEDGIRSLIKALERRRSFLKSIDDNRDDDRTHTMKPVKDLITACNEAEVAIEKYLLKRKQRGGKVMGCIDHVAIGSLRKLRKQIKDIDTKINMIVPVDESDGGVVEEDPLNLTSGGGSLQEKVLGFEDEVVGFDDHVKAITNKLTEGEMRRSVVSIVGMGGLGKTTLANQAYKHNNIDKHFNCKAWIHVSLHYRTKELLLRIAESLWGNPEKLGMMDEESLKLMISDYLKERKYLLVIDDIWRAEAWEYLKDVIPDASNGSRVLLTTRFRDIAESVDPTSPPYELRFLGDEESWELLWKKAFPNMRGRCPEVYESVGRSIARKCGGLPLQLVVLGGLLGKKRKPEDWNRVDTGVDWELGVDDRTSRVLALSYDDLPVRLKPCFLYLGVFPEDYEIPSSRLVRLWVAEGLVEHASSATTAEEVAWVYLEELIKRNLVLVVRRDVIGTVKSCRVHDLLLELSVSEAKMTAFLSVERDTDFSARDDNDARHPRRIASHSVIDEDAKAPDLKSFSPEISTLIHCGALRKLHMKYLKKDSLLEGLNHLRVVDVDLGHSPLKILPKGIGKMTLLRHLGLDWDGMDMTFPPSIGDLHNLQTLDLRIDSTVYLPASVWKLEKLRHLIGKDLRIDGQPLIDRHYELRTLSGLREPEDWSKHCHLARLTQLKEFDVRRIRLSNEGPLSIALREMKSLRSLKLGLYKNWTEDPKTEKTTWQMAKLLVFQEHDELREVHLQGHIGELPIASNGGFPPSLTRLHLTTSRLTKNSFARLGQLPELRFLTMSEKSYAEKELACYAGEFRRLESMAIEHLSALEKWEVEEGAMPMLRSLTIMGCGMLEELPKGLRHMRDLGELVLDGMTESFCARVREGEGEDWSKVRHVPAITIREISNARFALAAGEKEGLRLQYLKSVCPA
ncbi:putative disease resistance protein [Acorus calamus]|uniref:Disease resistance protein n=1 Tax=Acorus calamus TaxID=4465 RepID=A0AAV9CW23_ACOCL|nr:putative disease resistance protein [Acorus calamus]